MSHPVAPFFVRSRFVSQFAAFVESTGLALVYVLLQLLPH